MSLRSKTILYLAVVHLIFAAIAVYALRNQPAWLLGIEAVLLVSLFAGYRVFQSIFGPLELIRTGVQFISESDFNSRFREIGQREMDELTHVYNQMIDHLREERIRVQEQNYFLDEIIKASPSGIITFDFDGRIAMVNPSAERILERPASAMAGRRLSEVGSPFADQLSTLGRAESRIVPLHGNRRVKCQDSSFLDRGFPRRFLMLEELTEELRSSERRAYEKIIRMMSHEINNSIGASNSLLSSCLNYGDQLRPEDREDFENALNVAISRTHHLNAFMKSYADVIRLPKPELRPSDVKQLLEDIQLLLRAELLSRRIEWRWELGDPIDPVALDKNQMEQALVNILRNAIEAVGECGAITVRIGKNSGRPFVTIEDSGRGFSPEVQMNLFTPFFSTKENGRGIGLTIVQEILTQHRFSFSLESEPGTPTRFTILF